MAERVGFDARDGDADVVANPLEYEQRSHRRCPLAAAAKGGEVVLAEKQRGRRIHRVEVERVRMREGVVAARREEPVIGDAIGVPPAQRREPRVKSGGCDGDRSHPDVEPKHAIEPARDSVRSDVASEHFVQRLTVGRHVDVRNLGPRVNTSVGATGDGDERRSRQAQHRGERRFEHALHRAEAGLTGPAEEGRAVVPEVDPRRTSRTSPVVP